MKAWQYSEYKSPLAKRWKIQTISNTYQRNLSCSTSCLNGKQFGFSQYEAGGNAEESRYDRNKQSFVTGRYNSRLHSQAKQRPKRYPYESSCTKHLGSIQCSVVKVRSTKHRSIHRKRDGIVDVEANDSREEGRWREGLGKGGLSAPIEELSVLLKSGASSDTGYG